MLKNSKFISMAVVVVVLVIGFGIATIKPAKAHDHLVKGYGVYSAQCSDMAGNTKLFTGNGRFWTKYYDYGYIRVNVGSHYIEYPIHMCITIEPKK